MMVGYDDSRLEGVRKSRQEEMCITLEEGEPLLENLVGWVLRRKGEESSGGGGGFGGCGILLTI